eukprot:8991593-Pyramimonas_sp.AAC.1
MRRSLIRGSGSQCAAHERALFRRRSWARSASRRGPDGGSRVSWRAGSSVGYHAIRRRLMVSGMVST